MAAMIKTGLAGDKPVAMSLRLSTPVAHGANQSSPLVPAEAKNAKQAARDCAWLRNNRPIDLDVIDPGLKIVAA